MSADKSIKEDAEYRTGSTAAVDNGSGGDEEKKEEDEQEEEEEDGGEYYDEDDECDSCSSCSTAEAADECDGIESRRRCRQRQASDTTAAAAEVTAFDLLDARRLPDLLDPGRLVAVLDECLGSVYVRGCVVETWDAVLSDHLDAIAHLVLYQTPEHAVSQAVYEQLMDLSAALRPPPPKGPRQRAGAEPARVDADRVYGTLRSAARSLLTTRVDACCRQSMCRAVGVAVVALRANTRPVFSVENFLVEINEAANFANLYCTAYAKRICAALKGIYDAVMAGEYHPTNVVVQMAVMEKSIRAALQTLADGRATVAQKTAAQRSLLAELDGVCATVRMKNHGCLQDDPAAAAVAAEDRRTAVSLPPRPTVHFTLSPWRAPIRMYHQKSPASADQLLKTTVRLIEALVSEIFKPCLSTGGGQRLRGNGRRHRCGSDRSQVHEKRH